MNAYLRNQVATVFLLLPVATAMVALPTAATAQTAAPDLRSLHISSDGGLSPGAELGFTVEGSTRAQTSLRIDSVNRTIALKETSSGVYAGTYTITRQDTILQTTPIRVTMQSGNRSTVANYTFPVGMASPPSTPSVELKQPPVERLKIDRFTVVPVDSVEPGAELRFAVNGMPGGSAEVEVPGVTKHVLLREVRTGVYEGAYTIRKQDKPEASRPLVAILWQGEQSVSAKLSQPWVKAAEPAAAAVVVRNMLPRDGSTITASTSVPVSGTFYDKSGAGVDPKSVRFLVSGRNVTAGSKITSQSFSYRANLKPGRHTVDVTAEDKAGNVLRKSWSFKVVAAKAAAANRPSQRCEP